MIHRNAKSNFKRKVKEKGKEGEVREELRSEMCGIQSNEPSSEQLKGNIQLNFEEKSTLRNAANEEREK